MSQKIISTGFKRLQALRELNKNICYVNKDLYRLLYKDELYKHALTHQKNPVDKAQLIISLINKLKSCGFSWEKSTFEEKSLLESVIHHILSELYFFQMKQKNSLAWACLSLKQWATIPWVVSVHLEKNIQFFKNKVDFFEWIKQKIQDERFAQLIFSWLKHQHQKVTDQHKLCALMHSLYVTFITENCVKYAKNIEVNKTVENSAGVALGQLINRLDRKTKNRNVLLSNLKRLLKQEEENKPLNVKKHLYYKQKILLGVQSNRQNAQLFAVKLGDYLKEKFDCTAQVQVQHLAEKLVLDNYVLKMSEPYNSTHTKSVSVKSHVNKIVHQLFSRGLCNGEGVPCHQKAWIALADVEIVQKANLVLLNAVSSYSAVENFKKILSRALYICHSSAAKTLAAKHRTSTKTLIKQRGRLLQTTLKDSCHRVIASAVLLDKQNVLSCLKIN